MSLYTYFTPTKVIFGKGAEDQVGSLIQGQGCKKVLLHYGGGSARRSGLLDRIERSLERSGISYVSLGGVVPNPRLSLVYEGIRLAKEEGVDFILAIGGGSVIDSAKAIGYGAANDGDVWDFFTGARRPSACLPIGAVPTIAAAGSEMSWSSVITEETNGLKRACNNDLSRPVFAVMDPELTITLPPYQTACGCADILMHTMERYFNHSDNLDLTDGIAEALLRTVLRHSLVLRDHPDNYESRAEIMWAGSLSHNGLTGFGTDGGDWSTHKMEHELSGMFDVAHGAGLTAIWGSWARYVCRERLDRFVQFALRVMDVEPAGDDYQTALAGIAAMEEFFRSIGMPTSLTELGISPTDAQLEEMAEKCIQAVGGRTLGVVKSLTAQDVAAIYRAAK